MRLSVGETSVGERKCCLTLKTTASKTPIRHYLYKACVEAPDIMLGFRLHEIKYVRGPGTGRCFININ